MAVYLILDQRRKFTFTRGEWILRTIAWAFSQVTMPFVLAGGFALLN